MGETIQGRKTNDRTVIDGCISCGLCTEEFPDLFTIDDGGVARAVTTLVPPEREEEACQAAQDCPVAVIITKE